MAMAFGRSDGQFYTLILANAFAARSIVSNVTDGLDGSSTLASAGRPVTVRGAIYDLLNCSSFQFDGWGGF